MLRYSGVNTSMPINVSGVSTGFSNTPTTPSITTTIANTKLVYIYGADADLGNNPSYNPSGTNAIFGGRSNSVEATAASIGVADLTQASAGASGTAQFTMNTSQSEEWRTLALAIEPSSTCSGNADNLVASNAAFLQGLQEHQIIMVLN